MISCHTGQVLHTVGAAEVDMNISSFAVGDGAVFCTAGKDEQRFFIFAQGSEDDNGDSLARDVLNERPTGRSRMRRGADDGAAQIEERNKVTLHTTKGDIVLALQPGLCPRTCLNFVTLARRGYYDGVIFHRVIKGFMIQTGDGDGKGGKSMWGGAFEDEIVESLRHSKPGVLSMANSGPNTNGSQFFITTKATPWLDGKHTIFGHVVQGMDVCMAIEGVETGARDRPT